jgi:hypothetical protein
MSIEGATNSGENEIRDPMPTAPSAKVEFVPQLFMAGRQVSEAVGN